MPDQNNINNVNSNSIALFSPEGHMLRVSYRNEQIIFTIIPKVMEDGRARWPKDLGKTVMLRPHQCAALFRAAVKTMLPAIEAREDMNGYVAIPSNRESTNLVGFGYKAGRATFNIFLGVNNSRQCSEISSYVCDTTPIIIGYDPASGHYEMDEAQSQLHVILTALDMNSKVMSGAVGQSCKMTTNFNTNQMIAYLRALATKLGVTPSQYGNFQGPRDDGSGFGGNSGSSPWSDGGSTGATSWSMGGQEANNIGHTSPHEVQQLSSLESLMGDGMMSPNLSTSQAPLQQA